MASNSACQHVKGVSDLQGMIFERENHFAEPAALDGAGELGVHDMVNAGDREDRVEPAGGLRRFVTRNQRDDDAGVEAGEKIVLAVNDQASSQAMNVILRQGLSVA